MKKTLIYFGWTLSTALLLFCIILPKHSNEELTQIDNSIDISLIENSSNNQVIVAIIILALILLQLISYKNCTTRLEKTITTAIVIAAIFTGLLWV
jgi:hypothetical protein